MLYILFSIELLNGCTKTLVKNEGGRQIDKSTYTMGVVACLRVRTMREGVKFLSFWCVRTS